MSVVASRSRSGSVAGGWGSARMIPGATWCVCFVFGTGHRHVLAMTARAGLGA